VMRPVVSARWWTSTAVDYPGAPNRLCVIYHFLSMYPEPAHPSAGCRGCEEDMVPSDRRYPPRRPTGLEREVLICSASFFCGSPDLRRLLTDYGFRGYSAAQGFPPTTAYPSPLNDERRKSAWCITRKPRAGILANFATLCALGRG